MHPGDPRFATFPATPASTGLQSGAAQLPWHIVQTANSALSIRSRLADLRPGPAAIQRPGPAQFASPAAHMAA